MAEQPILIFDTSGVNRLVDDPDSGALIAGLRSGFHVRLTFTSVSEIVATTNGDRRGKLLRVCRQLAGDCIDPQHRIIQKWSQASKRLPISFGARCTFDFLEPKKKSRDTKTSMMNSPSRRETKREPTTRNSRKYMTMRNRVLTDCFRLPLRSRPATYRNWWRVSRSTAALSGRRLPRYTRVPRRILLMRRRSKDSWRSAIHSAF